MTRQVKCFLSAAALSSRVLRRFDLAAVVWSEEQRWICIFLKSLNRCLITNQLSRRLMEIKEGTLLLALALQNSIYKNDKNNIWHALRTEHKRPDVVTSDLHTSSSFALWRRDNLPIFRVLPGRAVQWPQKDQPHVFKTSSPHNLSGKYERFKMILCSSSFCDTWPLIPSLVLILVYTPWRISWLPFTFQRVCFWLIVTWSKRGHSSTFFFQALRLFDRTTLFQKR